MKKRIISLLLAVFVIAGMFPLSMPVFAYEPRPELVPDFNRDGVIDAYDREQSMLGADVFTIWLNDDDDAEGTQSEESGDTNNAGHNTPAGEYNEKDYADGIVNGRCDLLDFFPVLVDVPQVDELQDFTWKIKSTGSANVNVVFTKLKADKAGDFYTSEAKAMDGETPLYRADTVSLDTEISLPEGFLNYGKGVLLIEGSSPGEGNIVITGYKSGSDSPSFSMPIKVANIEDMYRTINLRQGGSSALTEPTARKDADSDGRQFVFVHGYGVSHDEARGVASDFYKKLWQSGSDSMFTAVEWDSDESSVRIDLYNTNLSLNYYANVENAFAAAEDFKDQCEQLPGRKYLVGHSLGNMLISSAIQDFGLDYEKYFMLGASIAAEAFDKNAIDSGMIDDYWENNIPETERASHWYEKFGQDSDFRSTLTWKGRFEDVKNNVINFYSPSDEFLANCPDDVDSEADEVEIIKTFTNKLYAKNEYNNYFKYNGYWAFTEKIKGTDYIDVINDYADNILGILLQMNREGGWGLNESYVPGDSSLENTRFTPFEDKRMNYDGTFSIPNDQAFALRARLLADAIPAESYAAGSNEVSTLTNINLESYIGENRDWPSYIGEENRENIWKHNDTFDVAYYHTHKLFDYFLHEHSYAWNNEVGANGVHTLVCTNTNGGCNEPTKTEECTYVNGVCSVCGAKEQEKYVVRSWDGTNVTESLLDIPTATPVTSTTTVWETGWYVADGTVDISSVRVGGNVNLILKDDCKLTVGGITVTESNQLTIYAQKNGTGELISKASANNYAGIGGGSRDDGGIITIHGGKITAIGGEMAAGIGGGSQGACGDVVIYGGEVTAAGGFNGAGIGTGSAPRTTGGSIAIYGGKVTASTTDNSAMGDLRPRAIGGGFNGSVGTITVNNKMKVTDGSGKPVIPETGKTLEETLTGTSYTLYLLPVVEYLDALRRRQECGKYTVVTPDTTEWTGGWYVVNEDVTIDGDVSFSGNVHLILCDGKTLTVSGSISGDSGFAVYAQSVGENMGSLNASKIEVFGANSLVINGGNVTATPGGIHLRSGSITINGGVVSATDPARVIEALNGITINGGKVTATSEAAEAGIYSSTVAIYGGEVTATGLAYGIFAGNILIRYSEVTATGRTYGIYSTKAIDIQDSKVIATGVNNAGIYFFSESHTGVTIVSGEITATGGKCGIDSNRDITIQNGKVIAAGSTVGMNAMAVHIKKGDITMQGGEKATSSKFVDVEDTMAVYNQANERVTKLDNEEWEDILTDTYYRIVPADSVVPYLYYDEVNKELKQADCIDYEVIDENHIPTEWKDGKWYAVKGDVVISHSVSISGEVHLILTDESTLKIQTNESPLYVNGTISGKNAHLYLHSQSTGSKAGKLNCYGPNGPDMSKGGNAITVSALTIDGTTVSANGGNGGIGKSLKGGNAIDVSILTVNNATVTAVGGVGGRGFSEGGTWGAAWKGGIGGSGIKCLSLVMNEGSVYATGGVGGAGGKTKESYLDPGASGASVTLNEGGVIDGAVTVKANEADEYIPLPSGESISDYQFAKITKTFVPDSLAMDVLGNEFFVTANGKDAGHGIVIVALYDNADLNRLLDVKLFDLENGDTPEGEFTQAGYVKAMWWSDLSTMTSLCEAKCYPPVEAAPTPTPTPTPGGDDSGYTSDDYGGGDSGGGISDFSGGGSGGQSSMPDSLPTPIGARLVYDSWNIPVGVDIIENATLKEDGTINSTNINFANDKNLAKAVAATNEILEKECGFKKHLCLAVFNKSDMRYPIKIKLDPTYRNKKAYIFHYDKSGNLVNAAPGLKYITKILSSPDFVDDILSMNIEPFETVIIGFGTK